ncbi:hypothetical protein [Nostoc sp.]|uniref:hypothetical protein n=1 Tax=Nostoc sp. TaxID=1180 RepID=UPI002FFC14F3
MGIRHYPLPLVIPSRQRRYPTTATVQKNSLTEAHSFLHHLLQAGVWVSVIVPDNMGFPEVSSRH